MKVYLTAVFLTACIVMPTLAQTFESSSSYSYSSSSSNNRNPFTSSFSSRSSSISMRGVSLLTALANIGQVQNREILLTPKAAKTIIKQASKISFEDGSGKTASMIEKALAAAKLEFELRLPTSRTDSIWITIPGEVPAVPARASERVAGFSVASLHLESALRQPITLSMIQTPVPFVMNMLEDMANVKIGMPKELRDPFFVRQPVVSVQARGTALKVVLESVAEQLGAAIEVKGGQIAFRFENSNI